MHCCCKIIILYIHKHIFTHTLCTLYLTPFSPLKKKIVDLWMWAEQGMSMSICRLVFKIYLLDHM